MENDDPIRKPVPDPTSATTAQLLRESDLKERLARVELQGAKGVIKEMIKGVRRDLNSAKEIRVEQKADIEKARSQLETASKEALAAALAAQKEAAKEGTIATQTANDKTEKSVKEQLAQLGEKFDGTLRPLQDSITEVKERLNTVETRLISANDNRAENRASSGTVITIAGLSIGFMLQTIGLILLLVLR